MVIKVFANNSDKFDQHFLIDQNIIKKYVEVMDLHSDDYVIEIGPGECVISRMIASKVKKLDLIELDQRLSVFINPLISDYNNVSVTYGDVLDVYINSCDKIVSSLPYSITEPFIEKLLRSDFKKCILIVGKKFALSVINNNITKLALLTNSFFNVKYHFDITPECFNPAPRVMSSVITITKKDKNDISDRKLRMFRELFFNRTKKIKNSLMEAFILLDRITKREAKNIIDEMNLSSILDKNIENLSNEEIKMIYERL